MKLDQTYSLLSARDVSVVLEFFKALDVRGEMALDGNSYYYADDSDTAATLDIAIFYMQIYSSMYSCTVQQT